MTLSTRAAVAVFVGGLLLGAVGPAWGWMGSRTAMAECESGLEARTELARAQRADADAAREQLGKELGQARAAALSLRALSDMDADNYGLARERIGAASQALEAAGQADAASRLRRLSLDPADAATARAEILATAEGLIKPSN